MSAMSLVQRASTVSSIDSKNEIGSKQSADIVSEPLHSNSNGEDEVLGCREAGLAVHDEQRTNNWYESASSSSDDEEDDEEEEDEESMGMLERQQQNILRNEEHLKRLGLFDGGFSRTRKVQAKKRTKTPKAIQKKGILLSHEPQKRQFQTLDDLYQLFPFREHQIRKLNAILEASVLNTSTKMLDPPPLFVSGDKGSGKTAVVRSCVDFVRATVTGRYNTATQRSIGTLMADAYVNCAALDSFSIGSVTSCALRQLSECLAELVYGRKRVTASLSIGSPSPKRGLASSPTIDAISSKKRKLAKHLQKLSYHEANSVAAVLQFGNSLLAMAKELRDGGRCNKTSFVLILDNADHLLSFDPTGGTYLSQLVLLPRTLNVSLTVVVISRSVVLPFVSE